MNGAPAPLRGWLLTDGTPGHESQAQGIVDAIARFRPATVERVPVRVRRKFLKSISRLLLRVGKAQWLLAAAHELDLPPGQPDFIVSSGGNTLLASALIARRYGVPNFYSGTPKGFSTVWFSCVFTVTGTGDGSQVVLPLPPVPGELCVSLPPPPADAPLALLVGGDADLRYAERDWAALAQQAAALAARTGRGWLLTTSRRTGAAAEEILAGGIPASALVDAVWWSRAPRRELRNFLARAGAVYVTGDSMTMIAEAIYAGRPVHVLLPAAGALSAQDAAALDGYARAGYVRVHPLAALATEEPGFAVPALPDVQALIHDALRWFLP